MAFAEGVVDLGHQHAQMAVGVMHLPEADGVEHMAEYARKALQPHRAHIDVRARHLQPRPQPRHGITAVARAMIRKMKGDRTAAVDPEQP
ncbi:hypothetical protein D3C73_1421970 [compost metagenome]